MGVRASVAVLERHKSKGVLSGIAVMSSRGAAFSRRQIRWMTRE